MFIHYFLSHVSNTRIKTLNLIGIQVEMVRGLLASEYPRVEVRSVDGFQGREKEAVVVSLVRSNKQGEEGCSMRSNPFMILGFTPLITPYSSIA